jgi:hypothetical protein
VFIDQNELLALGGNDPVHCYPVNGAASPVPG